MSKTNVVATFHSEDLRLMSQVTVEGKRFFVDFYEEGNFVDTQEVIGHSLQYAEDIAENYVLGILRIDLYKMEN